MTEKHRVFAREIALGKTGTDAAIAAGYTKTCCFA